MDVALKSCAVAQASLGEMRIAQVTPVYPPYRGGMARVAFEYCERLRARGHDVHVFTPESTGERSPSIEPDYVHRLSAAFRVGNAGLLIALPSELQAFDIVHVHYPFFGGAELITGSHAADRPRATVLTYHMDATAAGLKGALFDLHRETVQPWILSRADRILVSSSGYADACALAGWNGASDRISICPFGVDSVRFQPGHEPALRAELAIDPSSPVILFVGSLDAAHRFKGLDVLLAALATVQHRSWHLVLVGEGQDRPRFAHTSEELGLQSRVVFAGDVSDDLLPRYYRLADMHILPSTNSAEAFGLVTLEAAASGIPSIVSDLPGVRTNVVQGTTGLIIPPGDANALGDAIESLLSSTAFRESLGGEARRRVEREYDWEPLITQLEAIYQGVLSST